MDGDRARLARNPLRRSAPPRETIILCGVKTRGGHAGIALGIPDVNGIRVPACREQVEIRLALHAEFVPRPAAVAAADQAERINELRPGRRVPAAVKP